MASEPRGGRVLRFVVQETSRRSTSAPFRRLLFVFQPHVFNLPPLLEPGADGRQSALLFIDPIIMARLPVVVVLLGKSFVTDLRTDKPFSIELLGAVAPFI